MNTNPTDLGWREPWRLWGVSAAPWNGGPAEVGPLVWKASEQLLEALGPGHPLVPRLPQPSLIDCHRNPKLWAWPLKDECFHPRPSQGAHSVPATSRQALPSLAVHRPR